MSNQAVPPPEPPHALDAERGVIGSMLIGGPETIEEVKARLNPEAFFVGAHQTVFRFLLIAYGSGMAVDLVTFTQALRDAGVLEQIGGAAALTSMFTFVPTPANVTYYVDIVREKWMLRQVIEHCSRAIQAAYHEQNEPTKVLDDLASNVIEIGQLTTSKDPIRHVREFVGEAITEIETRYRLRGKPIGLSSGFVDLDGMTGGFQAPLTYYFAGRPAMGKSSVMVEVAEHIAIANAADGVAVGIFSIEMTARQLVKRILCARSKVDLGRLGTARGSGFLASQMLDDLKEDAPQVAAGNLWIDETSSLDILEFRFRARRMVVKRKVKLIIIDYIQRMHSRTRRAQNNREQEINEIAQGISATAKELGIPIIVLAQLNRKNEERGDKVPALSDLRESGSMEQEARFVGLLHRPVYYAQTADKKEKMAEKMKMDVEELEQHAELIVAKQNEGPVGTIKLRFVKEYAQFQSVTERLYSNDPEQRQEMEEEDV